MIMHTHFWNFRSQVFKSKWCKNWSCLTKPPRSDDGKNNQMFEVSPPGPEFVQIWQRPPSPQNQTTFEKQKSVQTFASQIHGEPHLPNVVHEHDSEVAHFASNSPMPEFLVDLKDPSNSITISCQGLKSLHWGWVILPLVGIPTIGIYIPLLLGLWPSHIIWKIMGV